VRRAFGYAERRDRERAVNTAIVDGLQ
jgi:hypothetical protein